MELDAVWKEDTVWEVKEHSAWLGGGIAQSALGAPPMTRIHAREGEPSTHLLYTPHWSYISAAWPRIVKLLSVRSLVLE